jgi:hypothetical protein
LLCRDINRRIDEEDSSLPFIKTEQDKKQVKSLKNLDES